MDPGNQINSPLEQQNNSPLEEIDDTPFDTEDKRKIFYDPITKVIDIPLVKRKSIFINLCCAMLEYKENKDKNNYIPNNGINIIRNSKENAGIGLQYGNYDQQDTDETIAFLLTDCSYFTNILKHFSNYNTSDLLLSEIQNKYQDNIIEYGIVTEITQVLKQQANSLLYLTDNQLKPLEYFTYLSGILVNDFNYNHYWIDSTLGIHIQVSPNHCLQNLINNEINGLNGLYRIPIGPVLILSIYPFNPNTQNKNITFTLDINSFLDDILIDSQHLKDKGFLKMDNIVYEICGFTVHSGPSMNSGHYHSVIKKKDGWWFCSDGYVFKISSKNITNKQKQNIWNFCFEGNNLTRNIILQAKNNNYLFKDYDNINNKIYENIDDLEIHNPIGMTNCGNTCFYNSTFQCLYHNKYFNRLLNKLCKEIKIISWNMQYNAPLSNKNNMIEFINQELPDIFCAQEISWFFPKQEIGKIIDNNSIKDANKRIKLDGYYDLIDGRTKNIAWCGGTNIVLIYWNPELFEIDPNYPLTEVKHNINSNIIREGNVPMNNNNNQLALSYFTNDTGRPVVGVRLIPKWNPESRLIIVCVHLAHYNQFNTYTKLNIFNKIEPVLQALDSNDSVVSNIAIMGDFNEYYESFQDVDTFELYGTNKRLNFYPKKDNSGNWKTIHSRPFDLFYSNFEYSPSTKVRNNIKYSDHRPIVTKIHEFNLV